MIKIQQWRNPETEVRLRVQEWIYQDPIKNQFIEYSPSIWLLWNYLRKVGLYALIGKLRSRFSEHSRNQKIMGLGVGQVLEAPEHTSDLLWQLVIFLAHNHSSTSKTVVVNSQFILPLSPSASAVNKPSPSIHELPITLQPYRAWSPYSGKQIDASSLKQALSEAARYVEVHSVLEPDLSQELLDHHYFTKSEQSKPSAVLFGLGNYAKTVILPNIKQRILLQRVHEIDPDQLAFFGSKPKI